MSKHLSGLLLAAGLSIRLSLRTYTLSTPKCLAPISSKPNQGRWLRNLETCSCRTIIMNVYHQADQVEPFLKGWSLTGMAFETVGNRKLFGETGTLIGNQAAIEGAAGLQNPTEKVIASDQADLLLAKGLRHRHWPMTTQTITSKIPGKGACRAFSGASLLRSKVPGVCRGRKIKYCQRHYCNQRITKVNQ
jgi:mannose-1-phosphate guanylyltransferase